MLTKRIATTVVALFAIVAIGIPSAIALSVQEQTLDQLAAQSPAVVLGTVMGIEYVEVQGSALPYTHYKMRTLEIVAGGEAARLRPGDRFTLQFAGGLTDKGEYRVVTGLPMLELGQTYLLMLRGGEWSISPIAGITQGAYRIVGTRDGQKLVISLDGGILTGIDKGIPRFSPLAQAAPVKPGGSMLKVDGRLIEPQDRAAPSPQTKSQLENIAPPAVPNNSIYREDNNDTLAADDEKRAAQAAAGRLVSPMQQLSAQLGGRKPITYKDFVTRIKQAHAAQSKVSASLTLNWKPKPLSVAHTPVQK